VNYKDFFASGGFSVLQTDHHSIITGLYKRFNTSAHCSGHKQVKG